MQVIQYLDRDDYTLDATGFTVYSDITGMAYYGQSLSQARSNRDSGERVYYSHKSKEIN